MRDEPGELPFGRIAFKTEVSEKESDMVKVNVASDIDGVQKLPEKNPKKITSDVGLADVNDYRRLHLRELAKTHGGVLSLSEKLGYNNSSFIVQMIGPRPTRYITEKSARKFEAKLHLRPGSLDIPIKDCEHVKLHLMSEPVSKVEESESILNTKQILDTTTLMRTVHGLCNESGIDISVPKFITLVQQAMFLAAANGTSDGTMEIDDLQPLIELLKP